MRYDIAVIGGGPAGLMAAATAAKSGLKTVLLERHRSLLDPPRLDASMFYFNFLTPEVYVEPVNVVFSTGARMQEGKRNPVKVTFDFKVPGFTVDYSGPAVLNYHYINLSPGGFRVWAIKDELWSFYFSREVFLDGLLKNATATGATIMTGARVDSVENGKDRVSVEFTADGRRDRIEADYAVVADGLNSSAVESLGLNRDRPLLGTGKFVSWVFEGLKVESDIPAESAWLSFNYPSVSPMGLTLSPYYERGNIRLKQLMGVSNEAIERFIHHTRYAPWFEGSRVLRRMAIAAESRTPLKEVVHGRCLLAGDSTGGMTGIMGAAASGYQAVKAITEEAGGGPGFKRYRDWFFQAYACYVCREHDRRRIMHRLLRKACTDDEVDFIFRRLEGRICHPAFVAFEETEMFRESPGLFEKIRGIADQVDRMPLTF